MSDSILHIKDSYYFEVPKALAPSTYKSRVDFPDVWVSLDPQFQAWEFDRLYKSLVEHKLSNDSPAMQLPSLDNAKHAWGHWVHEDHANFGKPFDGYLDAQYDRLLASHAKWQEVKIAEAKNAEPSQPAPKPETITFDKFLAETEAKDDPYASFAAFRHSAGGPKAYQQIKLSACDVKAYKQDTSAAEWAGDKVAAYNGHLAGKILIPQPFGRLKNLYEPDTAGCISKFMIIQVLVGIIMCLVFSWLGRKVASGKAPKGKLWNLLETFVVFIRDQVAEPAIGHHHAHRFTPLLWTIFFFVLGCNLFGMLPWFGGPTGTFSVTLALAGITFGTVVVGGMLEFGFFGFFKNQIPHMDLPLPIAIIVKPMLFAIEMMGLFIKHLVLGFRLLANMVAGHLVLLGIMGLAFGTKAALEFTAEGVPSWQWWLFASAAVLGSTALSFLELFVAFLQAYIFTFLSALFIGAAVHEH